MKYLLLISVFFLFLSNSYSQTEVGGTINSNTTWDIEGSPYIIVNELYILEGVVLTIEQGVEVIKGGSEIGFSLYGSIIAERVKFSHIYFWLGQGNPSIYFNKCHLFSCQIEDYNPNYIIIDIQNSTFEYSSINLSASNSTKVNNCNFYTDNRYYVMENGSQGFMNATHNYWNSPNGPTHPDNPQGNGHKIRGNIYFIPFETEPIDSVFPKVYHLTRNFNGVETKFEFYMDKWSFKNDRYLLWPESIWKDYDYITAPFLHWNILHGAKKSDFPSWDLFVGAFGKDQCYFYSSPVYRPSAIEYWKILKNINYDKKKALGWKGSCGGFAISTAWSFNNKDEFQEYFDLPNYITLKDLPDPSSNNKIRNTINVLWGRQFGSEDYINSLLKMNKSANEALADIKNMFLDKNGDVKYLIIWGNESVFESHAVNPYKIIDYEDKAEVFIYDNNASNPRKITIDKIKDSWQYEERKYVYKGEKGIYLSRSASDYMDFPIIPTKILFPLPKNNLEYINNEEYAMVFFSENANITISDSSNHSISNIDSLKNIDINFGVPISTNNDSLSNLVGFLIKNNYLDIQLNSADSNSYCSIFDNNFVATIKNENNSASNKQLFYKPNELEINNRDTQIDEFDIKMIKTANESEEVAFVKEFYLKNNESVEVNFSENSPLEIFNKGELKNYYLKLSSHRNEGVDSVVHSSIKIDSGTRQTILPDYDEKTIKIYNDYDNDGIDDDSLTVTDVKERSNNVYSYKLYQNYPNPFNPSTTINFSVPEPTHVSLIIYDVLGNKVLELENRELSAGYYTKSFDATSFTSGVYFYRLKTNNFIETKKMLLLK